MIALWYLLFFLLYSISWATPLVAPHFGEYRTTNSHSIPPPPSFLYPSPRAPTNVDTSVSMFSFAILPLLAYSTLLAIFGFISVRIARWRRKHRPAALTLDDDGVELLPTNTSTLSPEFKDLPVPPPLPSPIPSHARSRSFSNLQQATAVHNMPERERPKSPIHFGLSSPGSRLKSKQRSHSVGSVSSPLSPKRRPHNSNSSRRPFISDPESDADIMVSERHVSISSQSQFGTLVDLSVPAVPPAPASSPLNPGFHHMAGSTHLWSLNSASYPYLRPSTVSDEELNLIDLHAPDPEKHALREHVTISVPMINGRSVSELKEQDTISTDLDGYEPDVEGEADQHTGGSAEEKEIDISQEWGFESVSSLSVRVSMISQTHQAGEERDLVDGDSLLSSSPVDLPSTQLQPIPITASSSLSEGYLRPDIGAQALGIPAGEVEDSVALLSSSSSSADSSSSSPSILTGQSQLDADRLPIDVAVVDKIGAEDEDDLDLKVDNATLPSISRDDTSLDSDLIQKVYIDDDESTTGKLELGVFNARDRDDNDHYDIYESNDRGEVDEDVEDVEAQEDADEEIGSGLITASNIQDDGIEPLPATMEISTATMTSALNNPDPDPDLHGEIQDFLTPPPSHDKIVTLVPHSDLDVAQSPATFIGDHEEDKSQYPDPDLLPLPELDIPLLPKKSQDSPYATKEEPDPSAVSVSLASQTPTPPASPPQQRRPLPRPLPAWSVRAADAPPLGLATRSPLLRSKLSLSHIVLEDNDATVAKTGIEIVTETEVEDQTADKEEISLPVDGGKVGNELEADLPSRTETPVPSTVILPGAFPVDVHPLLNVTEPEVAVEQMTTKETGSPSPLDEPIAEVSTDVATSTSTSISTSVTKPAKRRPARSPIDIALAMQLRPGLGLGADPAWMVRFLMAMFGWFVVLISGNAGDGYGTPYVGIRKSD